MRKKITILLFMVLSVIGLWVGFQWDNLKAFPHIISSFYSKEFCSCIFVMQLSEKQCHDFSRQWIPISKFELDSEKKSVRVTGLGITHEAKYVSERFGCLVDQGSAD